MASRQPTQWQEVAIEDRKKVLLGMQGEQADCERSANVAAWAEQSSELPGSRQRKK